MRVIFGFLLAGALMAQTPEALTFEVATIKASAPPGMGPVMFGPRGGPGTQDPGRFTCERCSLTLLLTNAYDINQVRISGPEWLSSTMFDVIAKVPAGATRGQFRVMLQNLLIDRFKMAAHHDTRDMAIYELTVAKSGPKLKESAGPEEAPNLPGRGGPPPPPGPHQTVAIGDGAPPLPPGRRSLMALSPRGAHWRLVDVTMDDFVRQLPQAVGRPVNNGTGIKGKYDIDLTFAPDLAVMGRGRGMMMRAPLEAPAGGDAAAPDEAGPTIFTAVQEQLGLKLESKKGPVDMLGIDHIEKTPTEN